MILQVLVVVLLVATEGVTASATTTPSQETSTVMAGTKRSLRSNASSRSPLVEQAFPPVETETAAQSMRRREAMGVTCPLMVPETGSTCDPVFARAAARHVDGFACAYNTVPIPGMGGGESPASSCDEEPDQCIPSISCRCNPAGLLWACSIHGDYLMALKRKKNNKR